MAKDRICQCGHAAQAHEHLRRGSDCGICGAAICARYHAGRRGAVPINDVNASVSSDPAARRASA